MAQTTSYEIANSSGLVFRGRVNEVFAAAQSSNSGSTAPASPTAGMLWFDTSVTPAILRRRNSANSAWIDVYSTEDLASQAEAEAGSDNTKLMTPLRVAQAISTQAGMVLLGTLTTTSGTTQTLSSLVLTSYKRVLVEISNVSHDNASNRALRVGTATTGSSRASTIPLYGTSEISLLDGLAVSAVDQSSSSARNVFIELSGITSASTSIAFSWDGAGNFDSGTIRVYGVR